LLKQNILFDLFVQMKIVLFFSFVILSNNMIDFLSSWINQILIKIKKQIWFTSAKVKIDFEKIKSSQNISVCDDRRCFQQIFLIKLNENIFCNKMIHFNDQFQQTSLLNRIVKLFKWRWVIHIIHIIHIIHVIYVRAEIFKSFNWSSTILNLNDVLVDFNLRKWN
jgi:hypothetical protein